MERFVGRMTGSNRLKIVLIRPGSTDFDAQGRIQGTLDIPLSPQGTAEVTATSQALQDLSLAMIYCSSCQAARQTASQIGAVLGCKTKELANMQNLNHGLWQGMLVDDVRRKQPTVYRQWQEQPECVRPPEGETLAEAGERVEEALGRLLRKHRSGIIGLVVPEPLASLVRCRLGHGERGDLWKAARAAGNWEVIDVASDTLMPN